MFTIQGNTTINITKGLNFTGLASFSYNGDMSENINGKDTYAAFCDRPFETEMYSKRTYGSITQMSSYNTSYILRGQLNYSKTFAEWHNVNAIAGAEVRSSYAKSIFAKRYGYDPITGNHAYPVYPSNGTGSIDYEKLQSYGKLMDGMSGQSISEDAFASPDTDASLDLLDSFSAELSLDGLFPHAHTDIAITAVKRSDTSFFFIKPSFLPLSAAYHFKFIC